MRPSPEAPDREDNSRMRIAQVAPLYERVPPTTYGGTERVVSYLTEELVRLGHEVTLFATGDSCTSATLAPMRARAITDPEERRRVLPPIVARNNAPDFDEWIAGARLMELTEE